MNEKSATHYSWWFRPPIDVGDWPLLIGQESQLFVDDHLIADKKNLERQFHEARPYEGNPVLRPEHPWEGLTCLAHGTVVKEPSGRLRMYYLGFTGEMPFENYAENPQNNCCVAYSEDGLRWEKPALGLHPYRGRNDTNMVLPYNPENVEWFDQPSIIYDPKDPDPGRRWKMGVKVAGKGLFVENPEDKRRYKMGNAPYEGGGYYAFFSEDGLKWERPQLIMTDGFNMDLQKWPLKGVSENVSIAYDYVREKFVATVRIMDCRPGITEFWRGRAICESDDFIHWTTPRVLFLPLEDDEPGLQFYSSTVFNYESMYLGLLRCLRSQTTRQTYFQLVSSRDGIHWERAAHRQPFIPNTALGTFGGGYHSDFSNPPIRMGDELWFYYGSSQFGKSVRPNIGGICISKLRVDGFASIEGGIATGTLTTRPLDFAGSKLTVNMAPRKGWSPGVRGYVDRGLFFNEAMTPACPDGTVAVEVLDRQGDTIPGYGVEDCIPAAVDSLDAAVSWKAHGDLSPLKGQTVRLRFHITNAGLYSFAVKI